MYDAKAGLDICDVCGAYITDGYCDCAREAVPDWDGMLAVARRDYDAGHYEFTGTFAEFLRWKNFPQEVIDRAAQRASAPAGSTGSTNESKESNPVSFPAARTG